MTTLLASLAFILAGIALLLGPRRAVRFALRIVRILGGFAYYSPVGFLCLVGGCLADAYCFWTFHFIYTFPALAIITVGLVSYAGYPIPRDKDGDEEMRSPSNVIQQPILVFREDPTKRSCRDVACASQPRTLERRDPAEGLAAIEWREAPSTPEPMELRDRLLMVRRHLDSEVVGQHAAKAALVFCGPTGVGKTELAESLARALRWPSKLFPMGQASKDGFAWKLFGAERGYFGSQNGGELTQFLRVNPESIVVFDEFEKGLEKDPGLAGALLNLLSEGVAYENSTGRRFDASQCVIVFTSNAFGSEAGIDRLPANRLKDLFASKTMLPLEFVNRLTGVVPFRALTDEEFEQIARTTLHRMLSDFVDRNALHGLRIRVSSAVLQVLMRHLDRKYGVRNLHDVIDQDVSTTVAEAWMAYTEEKPVTLEINVADERVVATFA